MSESLQHKLSRVRPPRVQITYDVEIGDAIEKKELPFVIGVLADLSGQPGEPLPKVSERKFVAIDRDNFDAVLAASAPRLALRPQNRLTPESDEHLNVELEFGSMEDFAPENIVKKVAPLAKLFEARGRLRDLLTKLDGNDELDQLLGSVVANTESQQALRSQLGEDPADVASDGGGGDAGPDDDTDTGAKPKKK